VRRAWSIWFVVFVLIGTGWALVTPVDQYPDEIDHVYRAVSVVRGEVFPHVGAYWSGTGAITNVPIGVWRSIYLGPCRGLLTTTRCSTASAPAGEITVVSSEGRNFPLYYALVGWPSLLLPGRAGWYFMRLAGAVWCAMLLATGALVIMSMSRRPLVLAGAMLVGLTPLALDLSGSINPSGLEAASALCFWAVLLALIQRNSALSRRLLVTLGLISGGVLVTCRGLGWLWAALAVLLSLAGAGSADRRSFLRSVAARVLLAGVAAATVVAELWSLTFRSYQVFRMDTAPAGLVAAARTSLGTTTKLLRETLAYLGWLTIPPPAVAEVCWILAAAAVIVTGMLSGWRTGLLTVAGAALVIAVPFAILTFAFAHPAIGIWQGRYTLPLAIGVPLLAVAGSRSGHGKQTVAALLASSAILLVAWAQVAVYLGARARFAAPVQFRYATLGQALLALGALGVLANIAWTDIRWSLASRSRAQAHEPGGTAIRSGPP
jgi:hypothetical protein